MHSPKQLGLKITNLREDVDLNQTELAEELGISSSRLSNWEKGRNYPKLEYIELLCDYFKLDLEEFLGYVSKAPRKIAPCKTQHNDPNLKDSFIGLLRLLELKGDNKMIERLQVDSIADFQKKHGEKAMKLSWVVSVIEEALLKN